MSLDKRKLLALMFAASFAVAACGGSSDSSDSGDASDGAAGSEGNSLTESWANDWEVAGLENPGIAVSDWAISSVDTSGFKKDGPYKIGFASQGPTNSWATVYDEALKARAAELNVELVYVSADGKEDKQVNDLNDLLAQGVDAVVVAPMGPAIAAPVKRLTDAKVPVIACAGELPEATATVVRDNRLNGAMYAEWIAQKINRKGNIIMLSGILATQTAVNRKDAALEVFAKYPDIKILDSGETNWSPTEAKTLMEQLLTKHGCDLVR
jgi:ribose transport system substrate-binding protein